MKEWIEIDSDFATFVSGKSIALVGPSSSTIGKDYGKKIDNFDIVARVKSFNYPDDMKGDLGSRTEILYTTNPLDRADLKDFSEYPHPATGKLTYHYEKYDNFKQYEGITFVVSTYPQDEWFSNRYVGDFDKLRKSGITQSRFVNSKSYFEARNSTNRPNSGFSAIIDILSFNIKSLHIFGLDFHRVMYRGGYQNSLYSHETIKTDTSCSDGPDTHQPDLQYQYFKQKIWKKDVRVNVDDALSEFLSDPKYDWIYRG